MYKAYFDASVEWNKKKSYIAFVIYNSNGEVVSEVVKSTNYHDNNYVEWLALNALLKTLRRLQIDEVDIYGDNKNVIDIANGIATKNKCNELHRIIWKYGKKFKMITFNWISRKENKKADKLSKCKQEENDIHSAIHKKKKKDIKQNNKYYIDSKKQGVK